MPQLMEVLEYLDPTGSVMVKRMPETGALDIKWGAQLTVRESQVAVFFRDGRSLDVFQPGRHVLQTQNIPLVTKFITGLGYGTDSPFRAEVYYLNMKLFPNLKWGTREPILFRDSELQMIRLRSYGIFSIQIADPTLFLNKVVGTQGVYTDQEIEDYLRGIIIARLTDVLGQQVSTVFDLPKDFNELSIIMRTQLTDDFEGLGLTIHDYYINSVSVPAEVQEMVDARAGMAAVGNMNEFLKFKAALALEAAAENPGDSGASTGVGVGAGMGMGFMLPQMLAGAMQSPGGGSTRSSTGNGDNTVDSDSGGLSAIEKIKQLKELLDLEAITAEEYEQKKDELLGSI